MTLPRVFAERIAAEGYHRDPHQVRAVEAMQRIATDLAAPAPARSRLARWFGSPPEPPKGLYLWGGVGRGKTWMMDLFYDQLPFDAKGRFHFHRFMQMVHGELTRRKGRANPLQYVAADMARDWRVLCLDEFNVVDIGDAVILAGLLRSLFDEGIVLLTTSNKPPGDLYRDGIQRASFLPAIELLQTRTQVMELGGDRDYRQEVLDQARVYHTPLDAAADGLMLQEFELLANTAIRSDGALDINGRPMPYRYLCDGMVWFDFEALCGPPRSQNDYIELARCHHTIFMSGIPVMGASRDDRTRRFIFLIDEFYDRKVKLVLSAAARAGRLYIGERLAFEFQRTVSRLTEMQTAEYLGKSHLG